MENVNQTTGLRLKQMAIFFAIPLWTLDTIFCINESYVVDMHK